MQGDCTADLKGKDFSLDCNNGQYGFVCHSALVLFVCGRNHIWAACGLHSFWNAVLYSVLGLNLSGNDETVTAVFVMQSVGKNIWNGGEYGIEASVLTSMVLAIAAVLIWLAGKKVK